MILVTFSEQSLIPGSSEIHESQDDGWLLPGRNNNWFGMGAASMGFYLPLL